MQRPVFHEIGPGIIGRQSANCRHSSVDFETRKQTLIPAALGIDEKQVKNQYSVFIRSGSALRNWKPV